MSPGRNTPLQRFFATLIYFAFVLSPLTLCAQQTETAETASDRPARAASAEGQNRPSAETGKEKPENKEKNPPAKEEPPVVTHHQITLGGRVLHYTATTGFMPLRNPENDEIEANIFFMAYTLDKCAKKAADVLVQRRPGIGVGVAAPGCNRTAPREDASRRRNAPAAV
jgi:hypothetical protein